MDWLVFFVVATAGLFAVLLGIEAWAESNQRRSGPADKDQ
jgi:hypothetical protein